MRVNILGTEYTIEIRKISEDDCMKEQQFDGYCDEENKLIVVADTSEKEFFPYMEEREQEIYRKKVLRHELIHAFLNESGLSDSSNVPNCGWAKHEEMIDWIAIQLPKIVNACQECNCI